MASHGPQGRRLNGKDGENVMVNRQALAELAGEVVQRWDYGGFAAANASVCLAARTHLAQPAD
jgi:hypothetical protein